MLGIIWEWLDHHCGDSGETYEYMRKSPPMTEKKTWTGSRDFTDHLYCITQHALRPESSGVVFDYNLGWEDGLRGRRGPLVEVLFK